MTLRALVVLALITACVGGAGSSPPSALEYSVYSAALSRYSANPDVEQVIVGDSTVAGFPEEEHHYRNAVATLEGVDRSMARDFVVLNRGRHALDASRLASHVPIMLLPDTAAFVLLDDADSTEFNRFRAEYPKSSAFLQLSRASFSRDSTRAVINVNSHCGLLCGNATAYSFARSGTRWVLIAENTHTQQ